MARGCIPSFGPAPRAYFGGDDTVADGGELILYAPGVCARYPRRMAARSARWDSTAGHTLLAHPEAWQPHGVSPLALTLGVLIKGDAPMIDGREAPRIHVRLATGMSSDECRALDVGYEDPDQVAREIEAAPADVIDEDRLVMHNAGSVLWRFRSANGQSES